MEGIDKANEMYDIIKLPKRILFSSFLLFFSFRNNFFILPCRFNTDSNPIRYKIPQPKDKWHRSLARAYGATGQATPAMRHMKLARENDPDTCDIRSNDALISSILARAREIFEGLVNYKRQKRERERSANTEFMTTETERRTKELMTIAIEVCLIDRLRLGR